MNRGDSESMHKLFVYEINANLWVGALQFAVFTFLSKIPF